MEKKREEETSKSKQKKEKEEDSGDVTVKVKGCREGHINKRAGQIEIRKGMLVNPRRIPRDMPRAIINGNL
jgi:hypothetical protein